jgi:hypothetical protein
MNKTAKKHVTYLALAAKKSLPRKIVDRGSDARNVDDGHPASMMQTDLQALGKNTSKDQLHGNHLLLEERISQFQDSPAAHSY